MSNILLTARRVRRIAADAMTDAELIDILRARRIRYGYSTAGGTLHIFVPIRSGAVRIYRAEETARAVVRTGYPVLHTDD